MSACANALRPYAAACIRRPDPQHDNELRSAVTALLDIAVQQHQFLILIAARFSGDCASTWSALMRPEWGNEEAPAGWCILIL